jgi:hypothetical protein
MARMATTIYDLDFDKVPHVLGAPRFLYRQFLEQTVRWARHVGSTDSLGLLIEELQALQYLGYLVQCWEHRAGRGGHGNAEHRSASTGIATAR